MKLVVITLPEDINKELEIIKDLFDAGLQSLHVRKPDYTLPMMRSYIESIPRQYHHRLVLHSWHRLALKYQVKGIHLTEGMRKSPMKYLLSYWYIYKLKRPRLSISTSIHDLKTLKKLGRRDYTYVFLSPIYKSISKKEYKPQFSMSAVHQALSESKAKVFALGGIDADKIPFCKELGFQGVGTIGAIWHQPDPVNEYKIMAQLCRKEQAQF